MYTKKMVVRQESQHRLSAVLIPKLTNPILVQEFVASILLLYWSYAIVEARSWGSVIRIPKNF